MLDINGIKIGQCNRPYIIAEMACAHNGKKEYALRLIDLAVEANADAIQLQIFNTNEMMVPSHKAYRTVKEIEFAQKDWSDIIGYAKQFDIDILICTYDLDSLKFAIKSDVDAIKINSSDLLNVDILKELALSKLPFLLHTGASTFNEIKMSLDYIGLFNDSQIILMHGVQNFPTEVSKANISRLQKLKNKFKLPVGYSDHTDATDQLSRMIDLVAVGMGTDVLEKHITLAREERGVDYQSALEADEFQKYVRDIHAAASSLGIARINLMNMI